MFTLIQDDIRNVIECPANVQKPEDIESEKAKEIRNKVLGVGGTKSNVIQRVLNTNMPVFSGKSTKWTSWCKKLGLKEQLVITRYMTVNEDLA